uniref:DNA-directed DNA polymerase n=1 Tax=Pasiphaea japonica whispovirus TaxID=2984286 RepID=A0A9C7F104_9VIRU|nr:MAG: wsv514-like protein [Pasiphaea japonica whispovirus]
MAACVISNTDDTFQRCGVLSDPDSGLVTIYDTNSKFSCKPKHMEEIGVLSGICDYPVTQVGENISGDCYLKSIVTNNQNGYCLSNITYKQNDLNCLIRPSDIIESAMKKTVSKFKYEFTKEHMTNPKMMHGDENVIAVKTNAINRLCTIPLSTVGIKIRVETKNKSERAIIIHNSSGVAGFNIFNSSPVHFEIQNEMDMVILMAVFLKHNSLWGEINANMDLYKFDYVGAFFDTSWCEHEKSFSVVRSQLLNAYYKCKLTIRSATELSSPKNKNKRKQTKYYDNDEEEGDDGGVCPSSYPSIALFESSTDMFEKEALMASFVAVGGNEVIGCPHSEKHCLKLDDEGNYGCVACFSTIFYIIGNTADNETFITGNDMEGAQSWINNHLIVRKGTEDGRLLSKQKNALKMLADITQAAHGKDAPKLGPCGRRWNWPSQKADPLMHEYIIYQLVMVFKSIRDKLLPRFDLSILYKLLNPFGKMLLVFMHNCAVISSSLHSGDETPSSLMRGQSSGQWWTINFVGMNLWNFQLTKCQIEKNKDINKLACLETLQRLPLPGERIVDDRIVFKGFCRGENLGAVGELVADITQTVKKMALCLENRIFSVDKQERKILSKPGITDPVFSLEVTGFRPNRAQDTINNGRVNSRVMRILGSREGARVWLARDENAIIFEKINYDKRVSTEAMERAISQHRILYYDIETNTKDFTEKTAVITSIGFCLCVGGNISEGGERGVFGLAAPGTNPKDVEDAITALYPGQKGEEEYIVTNDKPQVIGIFTNEFEMLLAFNRYVEDRKPHIISGWNSASFDDPFIFTRIVKHISDPKANMNFCMADYTTANSVLPSANSNQQIDEEKNVNWRMTTVAERLELANTGMYKYLGRFVDRYTGHLSPVLTAELMTGANSQASAKFMERNKLSTTNTGSVGWFQKLMGVCCSAIRLDLMKVSEKAYKESLSEFNLNAVLAKVSDVADRLKNVKDEVDLHYHLLGFLKLTSVNDQAIVHVYCCKDAYLAGALSTSINKEGEIFALCLDSALTQAVVTSNLMTPLCIGEGAVCRNMGEKRSERKGVGIRRHSIATDTKGGMVSQPIVNNVPYQTIDMTSLYPMTMGQNNLCPSTFVTQRQIIEIRDRLVQSKYNSCRDGGKTLLEIIDECNEQTLNHYRPIDIAVESWKNNTNSPIDTTRLERKLGINFTKNNNCGSEDDWSNNTPPNTKVTVAGLDYFPEIMCDINMQCAAKVNDDLHIAPASLEYMLQVLPLMVIDRPRIAAQITAGECQTVTEFLDVLEKDFNCESDEKIIKTHWTFKGTEQLDFCCSPVRRMTKNIMEITCKDESLYTDSSMFERLLTLLDRIYRRINVFDSADDKAVMLWSSRLINVGMLTRTWNIKTDAVMGVIPSMQINYRADRVVMQEKAKRFAKMGDMKTAGLNKVGQLIKKLCMNSMYGCLALKARSNKTDFLSGIAENAADIANSSASGGLGGGTRHSTTGNQITENARCVFGNIGCGLQMALPGTKQSYGDTDSVFCVHNIVGDGGMNPVTNLTGRKVYLMDMLLKHKMATIIPILVNALTKGIRYVARRDAGIGMMNIAHERLSIAGLLFAKKTYHMLHFNENGAPFEDMIKLCKGEIQQSHTVDKFACFIPKPSYANNYIVPHNPSLIFRAAASVGGQALEAYLKKEGIVDEKTMKNWFSSSKLWMELDAKVINDLYASKIVDAETGSWIDSVTSKSIIINSPQHEAVSQANAAFTPYRKGAFVKKGISPSTKLKGLQSLLARCHELTTEQLGHYATCIKHHVKNFASHTTDPSMMITSARVNKLDTEKEQTRPNPMAVAINNHLNPSSEILLGEKFKTVTSVSAWSLIANKEDVPAGYYNSGGVRWNSDNMKGCVPVFTIKNLSVVPNAVCTIYKMVQADKVAIKSMLVKTIEVLCSAAANNGFSLRPGALSFNTGVIVTRDVAMACINLAQRQDGVGKQLSFFGGGKMNYAQYDEDKKYGDDRNCYIKNPPCDNENENEEHEEKLPVFSYRKGGSDARTDILSRLINATCSSCRNPEERERILEKTKNETLYSFIVMAMKLDTRVADQIESLICQLEKNKEFSNKKKQPNGIFKSSLDDVVAMAKVDFMAVLCNAATLTKSHWKKCPVVVPNKYPNASTTIMGVPFKTALDALVGKYKCTDTCDMACCQSLYFVLLYTLALKFENERRKRGIPLTNSEQLMAEQLFDGDDDMAKEVLSKLIDAKNNKTVRTALPHIYNHDTDTLVYLFEPSRVAGVRVAEMTVSQLRSSIKMLSNSTITGKVWNCDDNKFFGRLVDNETYSKDVSMDLEHEHHLDFITGIYHVAAVELATSSISCLI